MPCSCLDPDCPSPAKHPRTPKGLHDASTDLELVRAWWRRWPKANVGLRTGVHFDVLDCDGLDGMQAWFDAADAHLYSHPPGLVVLTPGDGLHIYVAATGLGNKTKWAPHWDWRGQNGYVVAPPSIHANGKEYLWQR